jgi:hypothetical protein
VDFARNEKLLHGQSFGAAARRAGPDSLACNQATEIDVKGEVGQRALGCQSLKPS